MKKILFAFALCLLGFLTTSAQLDLGVLDAIRPLSPSCFSSNETVEVDLLNNSSNTIHFNSNPVTIQLFIDGLSIAAETLSSDSVETGQVVDYSFVTTANLSTIGLHNIRVIVSMIGDTNPNNDTLSWSITTLPLISSFPYIEDFEDGGVLDSLWAQGTNDDGQDWTVLSGPTASINTGPTVDHTTSTTSGYYIYTEDSQEEHFPIDLYSPCFDINGLTNPFVSFWYHSHDAAGGTGENTLYIEMMSGGAWITLDSIGHVNQNWNKWGRYIPSPIPNNYIQIRFRGSTDNAGISHDIAIDDFSVIDSSQGDIGVIGFVSPDSSGCFSAAEIVTVTLENAGSDTLILTNDTLSLAVDNGSVVLFEELNDTLAVGDTIYITFSTSIDLSALGMHNLTATLSVAGDSNAMNDTAILVLMTPMRVDAFPYVEDFSTGFSGWEAGGSLSSWELGTPAGNTIIGNPPNSIDTNSWMTGLSTPYNNNEYSWVISPCFDFSGLGVPRITLDIWWEAEFGSDGAVLQSTIDGGVTWQNVGFLGSPGSNWYNTGVVTGIPGGSQEGWSGSIGDNGSEGWVTATHTLNQLVDEPSVQLRIAFGANDSVNGFDGVAFDNVRIERADSVDLAFVRFVSPSNFECSGEHPIVVEVANVGNDSITSFMFNSTLLGSGAPIVQNSVVNFSSPLGPGQSIIIATNDTVALVDTSVFTLSGIVAATGDMNASNNNSFINVQTIRRDVFEPNNTLYVPFPAIGINCNAALCDVNDIDRFEFNVEPNKSHLKFNLKVHGDITVVVVIVLVKPNGSSLTRTLTFHGPVDTCWTDEVLSGSKYYISISSGSHFEEATIYCLHALQGDEPFLQDSLEDQSTKESLTNDFLLYPNPNTGTFNLTYSAKEEDPSEIRVIDIYGREVFYGLHISQEGENTVELNLENIADGMYFVRMNIGAEEYIKRVQIIRE